MHCRGDRRRKVSISIESGPLLFARNTSLVVIEEGPLPHLHNASPIAIMHVLRSLKSCLCDSDIASRFLPATAKPVRE